MDSKIPLKPMLGGVRIVARSTSSDKQTKNTSLSFSYELYYAQ